MKNLNLFPKRDGSLPYVYLVYLILPISNITGLETGWGLVFGYLLIGVFLLSYQQIYWATSWSKFLFWFCLQLGIVITLSLWNSPYNIFMGFYPGYFISWAVQKKHFKVLMSLFITVILGIVIFSYYLFSGYALFQISLFIIVMILSPIGFYNFNKQVRLEKELDQANEQVKELVQKEERHRIARDLHDTLGHTLSLITLQSQLVQRLIKSQPEKAIEETKEIEDASRTALTQVRELVSAMRTLKIDEEIKNMEQIVTTAGVDFSFEGMTDFSSIKPLIQNMVGMCIREAGTNIVKHSEATKCKVAIHIEKGVFSVLIHDNGIGIDDNTVFGNGLQGMKERLAFIEGELEIESEQGTYLQIFVPLVSEQKEVGL